MTSFKKKLYTEPIISSHQNDLNKDWYVFFRYKHEGKIHRLKRREGINRIKGLLERLEEIAELRADISEDLKNGWNPILDKKRELYYYTEKLTPQNKDNHAKPVLKSKKRLTTKELKEHFNNKGISY